MCGANSASGLPVYMLPRKFVFLDAFPMRQCKVEEPRCQIAVIPSRIHLFRAAALRSSADSESSVFRRAGWRGLSWSPHSCSCPVSGRAHCERISSARMARIAFAFGNG